MCKYDISNSDFQLLSGSINNDGLTIFFFLFDRENFLSKLKQLPFDWSKMHNFTLGTNFLYEFIDKRVHLFPSIEGPMVFVNELNLQFFE